MICYQIHTQQSGKIFHCACVQFPALNGYGQTEIEAIQDIISKINKTISELISNGKAVPQSGKRTDKKATKFCLPLSMELTISLHHTMLYRKVSKAELAKLLALTDKEVMPADWNLQHIIGLQPKAAPKYKKVQRLLDIHHHSTVEEISEAFRLLDCAINLQVVQKNSDDATPIIKT